MPLKLAFLLSECLYCQWYRSVYINKYYVENKIMSLINPFSINTQNFLINLG